MWQTFSHLKTKSILIMVNDIGEEIKAARKRRGLKQKELAERVTCNDTYLNSVEKNWGKRKPSFRFLEKLADALNCNIKITFEDAEL